MADASNLQTSFLGGELAQSFQGRYDRPDYKTSLAVCLNWMPIDTGAKVRRGGTQNASTTRGGAPGRVIAFDVAGANPVTLEFTDLFLRFRLGAALVTTNDQQVVSSITTDNPAKVNTATAHGWSSGNSVMFPGLGVNDPLLQNRIFLITKMSATQFTIADAITGENIDGSTLGSFVSGNAVRVLELATSYGAQSWKVIRSVQAEEQSVLLNGSQPQVLTLTAPPTSISQPTFSLSPSNFIDGPYLDPFAGSICTYDVLVGNVTLTFSFQAYSATVSYNIGDYVLSGGQGYQSLINANLNNTPAASASAWTPVPGGAPVGPSGFTAADIGRHIRLFSEPPAWAPGSYVAGAVVKFNGAYYSSAVNSNAATPGLSTNWTVVTGAQYAQWTWGRILSVTGAGLIAPSVAIGNYTNLNAAFDGTINKTAATCATESTTVTTHPAWQGAGNPGIAYGQGAIVSYAGSFYQCETGFVVFNGGSAAFTAGQIVYEGAFTGHYFSANQTGTYTADPPNPTVIPGFTPPPPVYQTWNPNTHYNGGDLVTSNGLNYQANFGQSGQVPFVGSSVWTYLPPPAPVPPTYLTWTDLGPGVPTNTAVWANIGAAPSATIDAYAGQDFHSNPKAIVFATIFPSTDNGIIIGATTNYLTINLRAKQTLPANASDGTILGTSGPLGNTTSAVTIQSNNTATSWEYVWIEMVSSAPPPLPDNGSHTYTMTFYLGQVEFFTPNVVNGSVVKIQLAGPPLLYPAGTIVNTWRPGVYSNGAGWPTSGTYASGRLWLGGVVDNRFDASTSDDIFTFSPTGPDGTVADSNAISYTLNAPDVNPILFMVPDAQGVLMGTQKREWLIQPASTTAGLTPTNIVGNPVTHIGCAAIEPRRTEHTLVFVQKHQRAIMEAFPDVFSGRFTAPNLLEKARHVAAAQIQEIAYAQELTPTIWARCGDGSLFGLAYKRDTLMTSQGPTFVAAHRHALGSGRLVESITVGPSPDGTLDALTLVTNDPATGVRHVEIMTSYFEETDALQDAWQLDDAVAPSSSTISASGGPYGSITLNGLWHLNGKTVQVFAGGLDCGQGENGVISDFTVAGGSLTIPFGDGVSAGAGAGLFTAAFVNSFVPSCPMVVGFTYNSDAQRTRPMEPAETGARNGPALGKKRRVHKYALQMVNTTGLLIGTDFNHLDPALPETPAMEKVPIGTLFTGVHRDVIDDPYSFDGQTCWRVSRPWPAMITAAEAMLETQDE